MRASRKAAGPNTLLAHVGGDPRDRQGAVSPPVYHASTFLFPTVADLEEARDPAKRFDTIRYGQYGTPTTFALEAAIAEIEGGYRSALVSSGLAAITTAILALVKSGDHVLMVDTVYSPARHFCCEILPRYGVTTTFYDPLIGDGIASLIRPNTTIIFVESPGSVTFEVQDVPAIVRVAHAARINVMMDNTWASPYFFRAMAHGVDVSIQAVTKYVGGHSDLLLGAITTTEALYERVRSAVAELGHCISPDDAYLALRGLRTLGVRLERHQRSALEVAQWLCTREEVARVIYPALPDDPGHAIWKRDFTGASGLFGVVLEPAPRRAVEEFLNSLELFKLGMSFGGFESLALPLDPTPWRSVTRWQAEGQYVRLHVGLEDPEDLIADLAFAFERMRTAEGVMS